MLDEHTHSYQTTRIGSRDKDYEEWDSVLKKYVAKKRTVGVYRNVCSCGAASGPEWEET